jgi:hypothetical protein
LIGGPVIQVWDETGTTALGVLGGWTGIVVSDTLSDVGALSLDTTLDTTAASLLAVDEDRQLRVIMDGAPDMWWLVDEDALTYVSDDPWSEPVKVTCRSLAGVLDEALVVPQGGVGTTPADWEFVDATPGQVVEDLVAAAQERGLIQGVTLAGGATVDADGDAWPDTVTITYRAGTTVLSVLTGLAKSLLLEWRMNGRVLEIYGPGGGLDRSLPVALRPGRDVLSAPLTRTRRPVATAVVIEGEGSATSRRTQALAGRRAREVFISQTSVADGDLDALADLYLAAHSEADVQITHEVTGDRDDSLFPWVDYRPGDRVLTAAASLTGVDERRIKQVAATWGTDGVTVSLELGSVIEEAETIMSRQIKQLLPGAQSL